MKRPLLPAGSLVAGHRTDDALLAVDGEVLLRAVDPRGAPCALEVLDAGDPALAEAIEATARRAIERPTRDALVPRAVGREGQRVWRAFDVFDGTTLHSRIARLRGRAIDTIDVVRAGRQLADQLTAAHAAGLVHGHLRPGAVLLIAGPVQPRARLVGLGRHPAERPVAGQSPEQARGEPETAATDVYALGLVLYRALAGRPPFTGTGVELFSQHVLVPPPALPVHAPDIDPRLADLVHRMLRKPPAERPTMVDVGHALEHLERAAPGQPMPRHGRRARMVSQPTRKLPDVSAARVAVRGPLPPAVAEALDAAGFRRIDATSDTPPAADVLLLLDAPIEAVAAEAARWPAVVADTDPRDAPRLRDLARAGAHGVLARPLDPERARRAIDAALRAARRAAR